MHPIQLHSTTSIVTALLTIMTTDMFAMHLHLPWGWSVLVPGLQGAQDAFLF